MYQIKKGVPVPSRGEFRVRASRSKYPLDTMDVNDCLEVPLGNRKAANIYSTLGATARRYEIANPNKKFAIRRIDERTIGLWRTR